LLNKNEKRSAFAQQEIDAQNKKNSFSD